METPQVRPGLVKEEGPMSRVIAFFYNAAHGNVTIQMLTAMGIPVDKLGVTPPDQIEGGQGMILSIPCPTDSIIQGVEKLCRQHGAEVHRQGV